ncbi:septum formation family protein [Dactylosporangium sp. NPDC005572]|uniref:septum formation family protein n=1 Tax=Dactylosporangium sp. NPDC005572 TaxID=3156889 RepID=UPI0033AB0724
MRRFVLAAIAVAVLGVAAGCAAPAGVDKDLVDDWAMMAEAKVPEPAEGNCWNTDVSQLDDVVPSRVTQIPCEMQHMFETIHVGHFTGNAADGSLPPTADGLSTAYAECDGAAKTYLGNAWQAGRIHLIVQTPTKAQWAGGGRFFRCDVVALRTELGTLEPRKEPFKDALKPGGELALTCGNLVGLDSSGGWDDITPASCTAAHDVEFVGVVNAKTSTYPSDGKTLESAFSDVCEQQLMSYIGMSASHFAKQKALLYGYWMMAGQDEWKAGNHTARCYAMIDKKKISRSLKGAGNIAI